MIDAAVGNFAAVVRELGLAGESPFVRLDARGAEHRGLAYLRDFGGPAGIVVGPYVPSTRFYDPFLGHCAKEIGAQHSTVNIELLMRDGYPIPERSIRDFVIECLADWGYFGPPPTPAFLASRA